MLETEMRQRLAFRLNEKEIKEKGYIEREVKEMYRDDYGEDDHEDRIMFADPGGRSALRAASKNNPRNKPCPTCGTPNVLTSADVTLHYQCDRCADQAEGGGY